MIEVQRIDSNNFRPFGRIANPPGVKPLASDDTFKYWSNVADYEISGATEIGYCKVHSRRNPLVEWMEQHLRTPEILIPVDRPFVLPVMSDAGGVEAFQVEMGQAVIIGESVWHSACIPIGADDATYFVLFRKGTPHEDVTKRAIEPVRIGDFGRG